MCTDIKIVSRGETIPELRVMSILRGREIVEERETERDRERERSDIDS